VKPFRWAIFGTGFAARKFVLGLRAAKNAAPVAVVSRKLTNAESFAICFGVETALDDYRQAAERSDVDAIYVATPPSMHREHALIALSAGKPVLVEKPFAMNADEASDIATAADSNAVFCMEGMWTRFLPAVRQVKQMIVAGAIGNVQMMSASFSLADAVCTGSNLYNADLGGGALLHRGVYPLSLAVHLLGVPDRVSGDATIGQTGVDETTAMILRYDSGALAQLHAGTRTNASNDCWIMGTEGRIHLHAPIYRPFRITVAPVRARARQDEVGTSRLNRLKEGSFLQGAYQRFGHVASPIRNPKSRTLTLPYRGNGYHCEADAVRHAVEAGELESPIMPVSESVRIAELMDRIRAQW
jgi:predicted dehydrogenase